LPRPETDGIHAEVLWVDRFGNCQLNVGPDELAELTAGGGERAGEIVTLACGDERRGARVVSTFGDLTAGAIGLVLDSQGMYALALDQRSAAAELAIGPGDAVVLSAGDDDRAAAPTPVDLSRRQ
jgi:S-adenosyl-L-methionine hydrolase (adenosine-forming)